MAQKPGWQLNGMLQRGWIHCFTDAEEHAANSSLITSTQKNETTGINVCVCMYVHMHSFIIRCVNFKAFTFSKWLFKRHGHHVLNTEVLRYLIDGLDECLPKGTRKCSLWSSNLVTYFPKILHPFAGWHGMNGSDSTNLSRPTAFLGFL